MVIGRVLATIGQFLFLEKNIFLVSPVKIIIKKCQNSVIIFKNSVIL